MRAQQLLKRQKTLKHRMIYRLKMKRQQQKQNLQILMLMQL